MLSQEERKQIIFKLFIALKESNIFPGYTPVQIKEAAIRAEQRIYEESNSEEEYLRGMNERFQRIERVVSNRSRNDGRGKATQEQVGPYTCTKDQEFGSISGEPLASAKQNYSYGNPNFERGERRLSEQLFTENKQLFGKQDGFVPPEIMRISRKHDLYESDGISRFNDRGMESSTRGRSNSCNIQNSHHESDHIVNEESFSNSPGNPMFFRRSQPEVDPYGLNSRKNFQNTPDQRPFFMQREGQHQEVPSQPFGYVNQGFGTRFGHYDYGREVPKDENMSKPSIDMNFDEMQQGKSPGVAPFNGRGFVPLQNPRQFNRNSSSSYSNPRSMNMFQFSGKPMYGNQRPFASPSHSIPSHKYPSRMPDMQSFPMASSSEIMDSFPHSDPQDRSMNMFPMGPPQTKTSAGWMDNSLAFNRHYPNTGKETTKPLPIFFNQQMHHQPYFHAPRNPEQTGPTTDGKQAFLSTQNFNQWIFGSADEDPRIPYEEFLRRHENTKKNIEYFPNTKKEERGFSVNTGEYRGYSSPAPWFQSGFRNFFPEGGFPYSSDAASSQRRMGNSPWFKDGILHARAPGPTLAENQPENSREAYNVYETEKDINYNSKDSEIQHRIGSREAPQEEGHISAPIQYSDFPSEVNSFFKENEMEKISLDYQELLDLKSRLKEGAGVLEKSQKIYNAFKESFPNSELLQKYEVIKNLFEKQEEYLKYGAYFLKARSADNFIDQIKSLTVDMSHDLKSITMKTGDINYGECLMNAVKAFSERKKKEEAFGLNVVNEDAYE
ncbi:uncharacterized protein Eint_071700 [Encephalitozoon intestinalis ATCC 50506]|uniref:Mediator complex subunit 15 KIX domain-containing protein n=1 Tax=Encephalitozoon intestinalis (strain ATCC 50506) TaxID=876142 RepID=E0S894_ENCIT|nr:uncharacterized protein Eint_071700 [Encephalitozoon intestinalis ATCC 50506]ADM11929.1 hypothetical protein Eint_071700 [Encephalitozoon intestinalis ATCC 50506]UTX45687.1 hypothetical protein GPK93_07g12560 [Encephalitozoon intestinalis]